MTVNPMPDPYRLGQEWEAQNSIASANEIMAETVGDAFKVGYINEDWRAMQRRRFYAAQGQYDRAKLVLDSLNAPRQLTT